MVNDGGLDAGEALAAFTHDLLAEIAAGEVVELTAKAELDRRASVEQQAEPPSGGNQVSAALPYGGWGHTRRSPQNRTHLLGHQLQATRQVAASAADMLANPVTPGAMPAPRRGAVKPPPRRNRSGVGALLRAQRRSADVRLRGSRPSQPGPGEDQRALGPKGGGRYAGSTGGGGTGGD
jgi:hypothetical protein